MDPLAFIRVHEQIPVAVAKCSVTPLSFECWSHIDFGLKGKHAVNQTIQFGVSERLADVVHIPPFVHRKLCEGVPVS